MCLFFSIWVNQAGELRSRTAQDTLFSTGQKPAPLGACDKHWLGLTKSTADHDSVMLPRTLPKLESFKLLTGEIFGNARFQRLISVVLIEVV